MDNTVIRALFRTALNTESLAVIAGLRCAIVDDGGEVDLEDYAIGEPVPDWRHLGIEVSGWIDADSIQGATLRAIEPVDPG